MSQTCSLVKSFQKLHYGKICNDIVTPSSVKIKVLHNPIINVQYIYSMYTVCIYVYYYQAYICVICHQNNPETNIFTIHIFLYIQTCTYIIRFTSVLMILHVHVQFCIHIFRFISNSNLHLYMQNYNDIILYYIITTSSIHSQFAFILHIKIYIYIFTSVHLCILIYLS